jgi:Uma2 family endonuclease
VIGKRYAVDGIMEVVKVWSTAMLIKEYGPISEGEYQKLEARSPVRHEYVSGEVFAMTGGTLRHNVIAGNVFAILRAQLRNTPCRAFINDVRVRVAKANAFYYPDLLVSCSQDAQAMDLTSGEVSDAVLIVEALSQGTEAIDRREKLLAYRLLPSLAEYILISQDEARVEIHRRRGELGWEKIEYSGEETVEFTSIKLTIGMREIYEGVPIESLLRGPGER